MAMEKGSVMQETLQNKKRSKHGVLEDTQAREDFRNLPIQKVGVRDVKYPIEFADVGAAPVPTNATVSMYVDLAHDQKGTHMSRFVELLNGHRNHVSLETLERLLADMRSYLGAQSAFVEMRFPFFLEQEAPVTRSVSLMQYEVKLTGESTGDTRDVTLGVKVPVTTLCPCSKEISEGGAHNQRGEVSVTVRMKQFLSVHDLVEAIESCASCRVYSLLKREDEKFVTERAYDNPVFVEDLVREIALKLKTFDAIDRFSVEVVNFESIHNHDAFARVEVTGNTDGET